MEMDNTPHEHFVSWLHLAVKQCHAWRHGQNSDFPFPMRRNLSLLIPVFFSDTASCGDLGFKEELFGLQGKKKNVYVFFFLS